jgi:hypothetical protein
MKLIVVRCIIINKWEATSFLNPYATDLNKNDSSQGGFIIPEI